MDAYARLHKHLETVCKEAYEISDKKTKYSNFRAAWMKERLSHENSDIQTRVEAARLTADQKELQSVSVNWPDADTCEDSELLRRKNAVIINQ